MIAVALVGVFLILAGFLVVALSLAGQKSSTVKGAGVILIGPIPIAFGSDGRWVSLAVALAVVLVVLSVGLRVV